VAVSHGVTRLFLSLRTGRGPVGVLGIDRDTPGPLLTPDDRRLLDALCDQAAVAIERISLAKGLDEAPHRTGGAAFPFWRRGALPVAHGSFLTLRWRGTDSNFRFPER
jgi:hypothetical protein